MTDQGVPTPRPLSAEPLTEAGRVLLREHSSGTPHMARHILAIEAEAADAARAAITPEAGLTCANCGRPVVYRFDDPVSHIGCCIGDELGTEGCCRAGKHEEVRRAAIREAAVADEADVRRMLLHRAHNHESRRTPPPRSVQDACPACVANRAVQLLDDHDSRFLPALLAALRVTPVEGMTPEERRAFIDELFAAFSPREADIEAIFDRAFGSTR